MKKINLLLIVFTLTTAKLVAQNVGINSTGALPNNSAMLDVVATDKGILIPRMTEAQRTAITTPATGLLVYQTDNTDGFWYFDGTVWVNLSASGGAGEFQSISGVVQNTTSTTADDFVFGSTSLDDITGTGDDNRFFFDKSKAAFRAGGGSNSNWNTDSLGNFSAAFGLNAKALGSGSFAVGSNSVASGGISFAAGDLSMASGNNSTAMGAQTTASGNYSTAMGFQTAASGVASTAMGAQTAASGYYSTAIGSSNIASGNYSTAIGFYTTASGYYSTAMGYFTTASGDYSTAIGSSTIASGNYSTTMGDNTTASGNYSTAMGYRTTASGNYSTAMGYFTTASGRYSTAMGRYTTAPGDYSTSMGLYTAAPSYAETVVGIYNTTYTPNSTTSFNASDRLFVIGNGTSTSARSNAVTVLKNGNVGIGTATPVEKLEVSGSIMSNSALINDAGLGLNYANFQHKNAPQYAFLQRDAGETYVNSSNNQPIHFRINGLDKIFIDGTTGNVGIGTTNPTQAKLVVNGSSNSNIGTHSYLHVSGSTGVENPSNAANYSIYASDRIATSEVDVYSDARIKNIKGVSNSQQDLNTLAQIEITNYQLKDTIAKGNQIIKKVIAQQVEKVYPQAVTNNLTEVIPNIYQLSKIDKNGYIKLKTNLKVGDKVKLVFANTETMVVVEEVTKNSFKVSSEQNAALWDAQETATSVFVYGKEVNDFHTVDYEAIAMLNVSATQELLKRIELLEEEKASLKAAVTKNTADKKQIINRLEQLENLLLKAEK